MQSTEGGLGLGLATLGGLSLVPTRKTEPKPRLALPQVARVITLYR